LKRPILIFLFGFFSVFRVQVSLAQTPGISGVVSDQQNLAIVNATVVLEGKSIQTTTDSTGFFQLMVRSPGRHMIVVFSPGKKVFRRAVEVGAAPIALSIVLENLEAELEEVIVRGDTVSSFGRISLRQVEQFGIYAGKKSEVIVLQDVTANKSTNNARQIFARATGLNIWESDAAGLQLGIGGRGLNPNRTSNFNTRQNGYDIAADALGYPESYYTPPMEAIDKIDLVRGAASLQYGTQFGGMLNFRFKKGASDRPLEITARQTIGSWNFLNSFTSAGGTLKKGTINYYTFFQYRQGDGWRPNSEFSALNGFGSVQWRIHPDIELQLDVTRHTYEAKQAGGLTDRQFSINPRQSVRGRNWFAVDWNLAALLLTWEISARSKVNTRLFGLHAQRLALGNLERINVADLGGNRTLMDGRFRNTGMESRFLQRYTLGNQEQTLIAGVRWYRSASSAVQGDASDGAGVDFRFLHPDNPENSGYDFPNRNTAVFAEHLFRLSDRLTVTPGVRYEWIQTSADGFYKQRVFDNAGNLIVERRVDESISRNRDFVLLGIGLAYDFTTNTAFYANFSQNYRAITFTDLRVANPNFSVDENIRDERGFTADAGIRGGKSAGFVWEATLFHMLYRDRIGQVLRSDRAPLYLDYRLRTNVADARNTGLEVFGEWNILQKPAFIATGTRFTIFMNAAYIDARYFNSPDASIRGNNVEMVAPVLIRTGSSFQYRRLKGSVQVSHTARHFSDATNAVRTAAAVEGEIPAYTVADLSLSYFWKRVGFEASFNNITDARYFTRRAEAYPGPGIIPADARSVYLTMQFIL
jgi:Fe(3+) dicitrate transport protein